MTAIVAPAGYGKTTLGAQWYHVLRTHGHCLSWISLGIEHSEPGQFILAILDALGSLPGEDAPSSDASSISPSSLIAVLRTRLSRLEAPYILFLDDYHFAQTDAVDAVLSKLLVDSQLHHVKLVLMSRYAPKFPISALRVHGELRQIGVAELSFTDAEAHEFFSDSPTSLPPDLVREFNRRTEGWAVALQMLRLLEEDTALGSAILASFDGGESDMGAYLSEQVFANLPAMMQEFLVRTACFPAINRDMVAVVFDCKDMISVFGQLSDQALPITVLSGPGGWVRYHPVFHSFLKEEATRRGVDGNNLLRKAVTWLEQCGDCERAIRYALLCGDANLAAHVVESAGGWRLVYSTKRGQAGMFHAILEHAAEIDLPNFPLTTLGFAVVTAKAAQLDLADHYLRIAINRIEGEDDDALGRDLRVVRVLVSLYLDRWVGAADLSALEQDLLETHDMEIVTRALTLNMLAYNYLTRSELSRAIHYGQLAIHTFRSGGADFGAMHLYTHTGQAWFFSGDCTEARDTYDHLIDEAQASSGKGSDLDAVGQVLKAELLSACGEIEAAAAMLSWSLPHLVRHDTWFDLLAAGFVAQQRIHRVKEDFEAAHLSIDRARATALRRGFTRLTHLIDGERASLLLADGDVEAAMRYASSNGFAEQEIEADRSNNLAFHLRGTTPCLLWSRIYIALGKHEKARRAFDQLRNRQSQCPHALRLIELFLLEIRLLLAEQECSCASARLSDLMLMTPIVDFPTLLHIEGDIFCSQLHTMAAKSGLPLTIRQRLAMALNRQSKNTTNDTGTKNTAWLTGRELQVIELLRTGLSNKEIGRRLELSDNTVKFHLHNIYSKLNVRTRTAAAIAAYDFPTQSM